MKKAYYIMGIRKLWSEKYQRGYTPEEPSGEMKLVQNCFRSIQQTGYITNEYELSLFTDDLVGKKDYIVLSLGTCRHRWENIPKEATFGFIFNAQELIEQGALLGIEHLDEDYGRITDEVIKKIASTLPPAPQISEERLDEFMTLSRTEDPLALREFFRQKSIDPKPGLLMALEAKDLEFPGCRQAMEEIQQKVQIVDAKKLLKGRSALAYLSNAPEDGSCVLLVWKQLPVSQAIALIWEGEEQFQ